MANVAWSKAVVTDGESKRTSKCGRFVIEQVRSGSEVEYHVSVDGTDRAWPLSTLALAKQTCNELAAMTAQELATEIAEWEAYYSEPARVARMTRIEFAVYREEKRRAAIAASMPAQPEQPEEIDTSDLQTYAQYRPTGCDPSGLGLPERQNWLVVPVGRNRDSGPLDESNFASALKSFGGESDTCEVHRFGHWACGWFEILLVSPTAANVAELRAIAGALAHYPVLDDSDFSERECEALSESWDSWGARDCAEKLCKAFELDRHGAVYEWLRAHESDLYTLHGDRSRGDTVESDGGACFDFTWIDSASFTRDEFARWIRTVRAQERTQAPADASLAV